MYPSFNIEDCYTNFKQLSLIQVLHHNKLLRAWVKIAKNDFN